MAEKRNYSYSDVNMCLASRTIAGSLKTNIDELSEVRTNWTEDYATDLETRIDHTIETHLGIDPKKGLRDATHILSSLMEPAKINISSFKTHLDEDYKADHARRTEILKNLGLTKNLRAVQNGGQEALIELLYAFKNNMNDAMKLEITAKGMPPKFIDNIIGHADEIRDANVSQEGLKETTKEISSESIVVLNAIYDEVIGICRMASDHYKNNPLKKEQFTFSKVVANMSRRKKTSENPTEEE